MKQSQIFGRLSDQPTVEEVERLLAEHPTMPIVDESVVTFIFHGKADRVELRHWIYGLPSSIPLERVGDSDYWYTVVEFPDESRIEYKFGVFRDGHETWIKDPRNPNVAHDPFGGNSVVHCHGYEVPAWTQPRSGQPRGEIRDFPIESAEFGDTRHWRIYLPPRYRDYRRHRLVIVHDGDDYVRFSNLDVVLDNLIADLEIPPMVVAMNNPVRRLREYAADPRHARHLVNEALPALEENYSLITEPSGRCLMGASFGAVASLSTAWRFPGVFDSLLLQSGSFAFTDIGKHWRGPAFEPVVKFMNQFRRNPGKPAEKAFLSCGVYESLIYENRSMVPFLQSIGMQVKMVEARDGHNWENWRDRLRDGLTWLFPGPLWATYM